jgi:hypothetical protein
MLKVECYTGSQSQQSPVAFILRDSRYKVEEIIDRWYEEGASYFKVKADDGNIYLLKFDKRSSHWEWVFYQNPKKMNALPYSLAGMNPLRKARWEEMDPENRFLF